MKSSLPRALTRLLALSLMLACAACAGGPRTTTILAALDCGSLIGAELRRDVAGADLPIDGTVGSWVAFGDAQTGRLDQANGNTRAVVQTVDACDRQQAAVREALQPEPWYRRLFGGG